MSQNNRFGPVDQAIIGVNRIAGVNDRLKELQCASSAQSYLTEVLQGLVGNIGAPTSMWMHQTAGNTGWDRLTELRSFQGNPLKLVLLPYLPAAALASFGPESLTFQNAH